MKSEKLILTDDDNNVIGEEWRNEDGELHREDGPAKSIFFAPSSYYNGDVSLEVMEEFWYQHDKLHRAPFYPAVTSKGVVIGKMNKLHQDPAYTKYYAHERMISNDWDDENDTYINEVWGFTTYVTYEKWAVDGVPSRIDGRCTAHEHRGVNGDVYIWKDENDERHREDGPAIEHGSNYGDHGGYEHWFKHGVEHCEDGPSYTKWFCTGIVKYQEWKQDGNPKRDNDKPTEISNWCDGTARSQLWHDEKWQLHRDKGPAQIETFAAKKYRKRHHWIRHYKHGQLHRMDGPATYKSASEWDKIGTDMTFAIDGTCYTLFNWLPLSDIPRWDQVEYKIMLAGT